MLVRWAKDQDGWLKWVVARVLEETRELTAEELDEAFAELLREKGLAAGERTPPPELVESGAAGAPDAPLVLLEMAGVRRVNALTADQTIGFASRLTVLFGRNGCGKTGYVRVLKRLSSVRGEARILPDIHAAPPPSEPPEARIRYRLGSIEHSFAWSGEAGVVPFTRIDVFDAQEAPTYVDGELTYVYIPTEIALFRHVAAALEGVRARLDAAKKERHPGPNAFTSQFVRDLSFFPVVDALGATTDLAEVRRLAAVSEEEELALEGLTETIAALSSEALPAQTIAARSETTMLDRAEAVMAKVVAFSPERYNAAVARLQAAESRQVELDRATLEGEQIPGLLTQEWRSFVVAGERYRTSLGLQAYPNDDDACLYCRQPLMLSARELLAKYREITGAAAEQELTAARQGVARERPELDTPLAALRAVVSAGNGESSVGSPTSATALAQQALATGEAMRAALQAGQRVATPELQEAEALAKRVAAASAVAGERLNGLTGKAAERKRLLDEAAAKKRTLEGRLALRGLLPQIEVFVARAKWVSRADDILRRLKPIGKGLTDTAKMASERLVNQDFERAFRDECRSLNAPDVKLDFHGVRGQAARRKLLRPEYRLSDTLSEGEQKVVALADFLAEARLRTANAPVVFDDPVTSLDYERIREVAARLVALSSERQVVVFTHNIWFAVELLERIRDDRSTCAYYDIRAIDGQRGVVSGGSHPRSDSVADLRKRLNTVMAEARKAHGDVLDALVFRGYSQLRSLCEVAVESELFQGVIRRYEPNVRLTALPNIKPLALQCAADQVYPVYDATCRYIDSHSQPLEHLNIVRTATELEQDVRTVLQAIEDYRAATA